jgi:hypothetical protein
MTSPPLEARLPTTTNLLAPPNYKPGDYYSGDESCIVEEEIPPSWLLTNVGKNPTVAEDTGKAKGEENLPSAYRLAEEHLELLFDIRKRQD